MTHQMKRQPSAGSLNLDLEKCANEVTAYLGVYNPMRKKAQKLKDLLSYTIIERRLKHFIDSKIQSTSHPVKAINSVTLSEKNEEDILELYKQIYHVVEDLNSICQAALEFGEIYNSSDYKIAEEGGLSKRSVLSMRWGTYLRSKKSNHQYFTNSSTKAYPTLKRVDALRISSPQYYGIPVDAFKWQTTTTETAGSMPEVSSQYITCLRKRIVREFLRLAICANIADLLQRWPREYVDREMNDIIEYQAAALEAGKTPASVDHRLSCTQAEQTWIREACEGNLTTDIDSKNLASLLYMSRSWK